jgi:hypothetical protein
MVDVSKQLRTWEGLNRALMLAELDLCEKLLEAEQRGAARIQFLTRIQSRINRLTSKKALDNIRKSHVKRGPKKRKSGKVGSDTHTDV